MKKRETFSNGFKILLTLLAALTLAGAVLSADPDYQEAMRQTEDEWKAVRQTMQQGKTKLQDFAKKYQEYEDAVFSQDAERGIQLAKQLFNLGPQETEKAKQHLADLREMFNTLDKNGLKSKLKLAAEKLEFADKVAGEVENVWEFSKKFDPEHGKDNPTYGLRLIGDILKDGAGKLEKIPLVGQVLGKWVKAYGEVAGDFANALDRMKVKIDNFRGNNLCGQLGTRTNAQNAFAAIAGGEPCSQYFAYGGFTRLRGEAYRGNTKYFLFDPNTKNGYLVEAGKCDKVYQWHALLLEMRALDPDWLASRANSLKPETEATARKYWQMFSGWKDKSDDGWVIIDELGLTQDAYFYGRLDQETFVANYILTDKHHNAIENIVSEYKKHVLVSGTVYEDVDDEVKRSSGAQVSFTINGKTYTETTSDNGQYEIMMTGKEGDAISEKVSKQDFETIQRSGSMTAQVLRGLDYTLTKGSQQVTVTGTVYMKGAKDQPAQTAQGATVTASAPKAGQLGSATSGGDGSYSLVVQAADGVQVTVSASRDKATGSATFTVAGAAQSGVDVTMSTDAPPDTAKWTINVTVNDDNGKPLENATVTGGPAGGITTGGGGKAVIGPIPVTEQPFSVTLTASILAKDNVRVSGASTTVNYEGVATSDVVLTIPVELPEDVTISGRVTDANGVGLDGATVTGSTFSATSAGGGTFSISPVPMVKDQSIEFAASFVDGTNSYASAPQTATFDGVNKAISITLVIDVETITDVTVTGRVIDLNGKPIQGAAVSCGTASATTDGSGGYSLGPINCKLGTPLTIAASLVAVDGSTVAGQTTVKPMDVAATAPNIVLDVITEEVLQVTISGRVVDTKGQAVSGATVSANGVSSATDGSGGYTLPATECVIGKPVAISATFTDPDGNVTAGQASVTPQNEAETAPDIVLDVMPSAKKLVTITGRVLSSKGAVVQGASVTGGGQSTTTGSSGEFTLPAFEHTLGEPVSISASVTAADGSTRGGNTSVTPTEVTAQAQISINLETDDEGGDEDIDDDIDDLEEGGGGRGFDAIMADFNLMVSDLDGIAREFFSNADYFDQRLRELGPESCEASDVAFALGKGGRLSAAYSASLTGLFGLYADLAAALADNSEKDMGAADASFDRAVDRETEIEGRLAAMRAAYGAYQCDEDASETDEGDKADDEADPDNIDKDVEVCGDGIDNDGDGEIDECDAGCCDKNAQITVTDCGTAADDIFLIAIDGSDVGVTPKGAANTFNVELSPGNHTIKVTCLDDGGDPPGSDIGTACVTAVVFGSDAGLGGGELDIPYGGSSTVSIYVPEGPVTAPTPHFDGSTLQGLEGN